MQWLPVCKAKAVQGMNVVSLAYLALSCKSWGTAVMGKLRGWRALLYVLGVTGE